MMRALIVISAILATTVAQTPRAIDDGRYYPSNDGQYHHDNSGAYRGEDGSYRPDNSGAYVPDDSGRYSGDYDKYRHTADQFGGSGGAGGAFAGVARKQNVIVTVQPVKTAVPVDTGAGLAVSSGAYRTGSEVAGANFGVTSGVYRTGTSAITVPVNTGARFPVESGAFKTGTGSAVGTGTGFGVSSGADRTGSEISGANFGVTSGVYRTGTSAITVPVNTGARFAVESGAYKTGTGSAVSTGTGFGVSSGAYRTGSEVAGANFEVTSGVYKTGSSAITVPVNTGARFAVESGAYKTGAGSAVGTGTGFGATSGAYRTGTDVVAPVTINRFAASGGASNSAQGAEIYRQGSSSGFYGNKYAILRKEENVEPDGYRYLYETENKILGEEQGRLANPGTQDEAIRATGYYEYTGPDNVVYRVDYTADENGFVPSGVHIPTPPPIPEAILRSLQYQRSIGEL